MTLVIPLKDGRHMVIRPVSDVRINPEALERFKADIRAWDMAGPIAVPFRAVVQIQGEEFALEVAKQFGRAPNPASWISADEFRRLIYQPSRQAGKSATAEAMSEARCGQTASPPKPASTSPVPPTTHASLVRSYQFFDRDGNPMLDPRPEAEHAVHETGKAAPWLEKGQAVEYTYNSGATIRMERIDGKRPPDPPIPDQASQYPFVYEGYTMKGRKLKSGDALFMYISDRLSYKDRVQANENFVRWDVEGATLYIRDGMTYHVVKGGGCRLVYAGRLDRTTVIEVGKDGPDRLGATWIANDTSGPSQDEPGQKDSPEKSRG